jgi:5-methylcytosine-specific restriction endonuclease McrA
MARRGTSNGSTSHISSRIQQLEEQIQQLRKDNYISQEEFKRLLNAPDGTITTERYGAMRIDHVFDNGFAAYPIRKDGQRIKGPAGSLKYFYAVDENPIEVLQREVNRLKEERRARNHKQYERRKERLRERARELLRSESEKYGGSPPRPPKRPLVLSYELTWREDKRDLKRTEWQITRLAILERDNYTCVYCGYQSREPWKLHVNHVDGDPNNNAWDNLETICSYCHFIVHSGHSAVVYDKVEIYEQAAYSQEDINRITRRLRESGCSDEFIKETCGLRGQVPWRQDKRYLASKFGFVTSRRVFPTYKNLFEGLE